MIDFVDGTLAAPTTTDGDIYVLIGSGTLDSSWGSEAAFGDWVSAPNQVNYILDKEMTYTPGTQFNYSDGNAHLISVILTEASDMSSLEFAEANLFNPLETARI